MKRPTRSPGRQAVLFPPVADESVITPENKAQAVAALADLLLEAIGIQPREVEVDDEQQDFA